MSVSQGKLMVSETLDLQLVQAAVIMLFEFILASPPGFATSHLISTAP